MKKMLRLRYFFLATIFALSFHFLSQNVEAAMLGVGLGNNVYDRQDVDDLGYPWVFNWEANNVLTNSANQPYRDFGERYVPMFWNCDYTAANKILDWIEATDYKGYVLVFNEPDTTNKPDSCSTTTARDFFHYISTEEPSLKYIVGGVRTDALHWVKDFAIKYNDKYKKYPPVAGVHAHVYPTSGTNDPVIVADGMNKVINRYMNWLEEPSQNWMDGKEFWITEYGVLNISTLYEFNENQVEDIFIAVTNHINTKPRINRAAWFTFSHLPAHTSEWGVSALTEPFNSVTNGSTKSLYNVFKTKCLNEKKCNQITVRDASVPLNQITNNYSPAGCTWSKWCRWNRNDSSWNNMSTNGKLELRTKATSGNYGACWIHWMSNIKNGLQYKIQGAYTSTNPFPNNKAFIQVEVSGNANYLSPPIYLNGSSGTFTRTFISSSTSTFQSMKFCTWGTGLSSDANVTLTKFALTEDFGGGGTTY